MVEFMELQEPPNSTKTENSRRNSIRDELGWGKTERTQSEKIVEKARTRRKRAPKATDQKLSIRQKKPSDQKKPKIILQSIAVADEDSNSWSDDSYESTDLEVMFESADEDLDNGVILSRVRRLGNHKQVWKNDKEFYMVAFAYLISPDAIVSAIYGCRKFGGEMGLLICLAAALIAFPVTFLELALGQFTSSSSFSVFKFMIPAFTGLSALMTLMNLVMLLNDFVLFAMTLTLVSDSINSVSRVSSCFNRWNDITCSNALNPCADISAETGMEYIPIQGRCVQQRWYTHILRDDITNGSLRQLAPSFQYLVSYLTSVNENGREAGFFPSEHLLVYSSLTFGLVLLTNRLSTKSIAKFCTLSFSMILVFLATVTLNTFANLPTGFVAFEFQARRDNTNTDLSYTDFACWLVAHTLIVSKIGQGGLIALASQNPFRGNIFKHTFILVLVAFLIPQTIAFCVHPFMDNLLWRSVQDFNLYHKHEHSYFGSHSSGFNTIWSDTMSAFFAALNNGLLFGNLFVATIFCVFFTHKIVRIKTLMLPAIERFGIDVKIDLEIIRRVYLVWIVLIFWMKMLIIDLEIIRRVYLVWIVLIFWMKMLIPHKTEAFFATISGASVIVFYEILCVFFFYGPRRFLSNLNLMMFGMTMNGKQSVIEVYVRQIYNLFVVFIFIVFVGLVPIYLMVLVVLSAYRYTKAGGSVLIAVVFPLTFLVFVPLVAIFKVYTGWLRNQLAVNLFKPVPHLWGPKEERDRKRAENEERQLRI